MNGLTDEGLVEALHMRNFQSAHGADRCTQGFVGTTVPSHGFARGPQGAEDLRPFEALSVTMVAEAHRVPRFGWMPTI
jgi:hypothetical protein